MKKHIIRALALLLILAMLLPMFFGCGKPADEPTETEPAQTSNLGAEQEIPWIDLTDWSFKTANKVEWTFTQVGASDGNTYGDAVENVVEAGVPIQNWDVGAGVYQNVYRPVSAAQYLELVNKLKDAGYQVYSQGDINEDVYYTLLTYQDFVYNLTYFGYNAEVYVTASAQRPLSPYLLEDNASTQSQAIGGMETKLTMLNWQEGGGDNYIIQLKNGHFILFDGGTQYMLQKTIEFMEANTPEGQTPVVEAWFITHGHYDHVGWTRGVYGGLEETKGMFRTGEVAGRIRVNGIYFNQTNDQIIEHTVYGWRSDGFRNKNDNPWPYKVEEAAKLLLTESGEQTPVYRPQSGQTYYFKDLTVEVPYCQEQITFDNYQMDINASSTWYLVRAEGRSFLDAGDTENVNLSFVKEAYAATYTAFGGNVDIMSAFHHGHNVYSDLIDTYWAPIVFYTSKTMFSWASEYTQANKDMIEKRNVSYYCYGDGAYQYSFATGEVTQIG